MMLARVGFVLLVVFAFDACNAVGRRGAETSYAIAETTWESDYSANRAGNDEMEELADEDLLDLSETLGAGRRGEVTVAVPPRLPLRRPHVTGPYPVAEDPLQ